MGRSGLRPGLFTTKEQASRRSECPPPSHLTFAGRPLRTFFKSPRGRASEPMTLKPFFASRRATDCPDFPIPRTPASFLRNERGSKPGGFIGEFAAYSLSICTQRPTGWTYLTNG